VAVSVSIVVSVFRHIKQRSDTILRSLGGLGVLVVCMGAIVLYRAETRPHFIRLLHRALVEFTSFKGTTPWGFISSDILQPVLLLVFFIVLLRGSHGEDAVRIHWKKDGIIGLKAIGLLVIFYFLPLFLWKGAVIVWEDHHSIVGKNQQLLSENADLRSQLSDANNNAQQRCEQAKNGEIQRKGGEIQRLKQQLNAACYLPDRRLSDEQRDDLFHLLKTIKQQDPKAATVSLCVEFHGDMESWNFQTQVQKVFRDAEWAVLMCDQKVVELLAKTFMYRGIVFLHPDRNNWAMNRIESKFSNMGFDVAGGSGGPTLEGLHDLMLLVGYKVGYQGLPD
jgi:hypothetical protein